MPKLLSSEQLAAHVFPTPPYLVEPVIPQGGLFILHGKPGVGKTNLILSLAQAVNSGSRWLNTWECRKGPVVVAQADMTGQIQQERLLRVLSAGHVNDTHWIVEEDGSTPYVNIQTFAYKNADLVAAIRDIDPALIVWDTLRKIHHLPENASESAIIVYDKAREICSSSTHTFVHHDRKESRDPDADQHADEAFMGNQQWKGAVDATASLKEIGSCVPKRVVLTFHKARTSMDEHRQPVVLEIDTATIQTVAVR